MAGVLETVNQRTQLVGSNRMELLLFRLSANQLFGINVFKVREVMICPELVLMPGCHSFVRGVVHVRFGTVPVIDMGKATGQEPVEICDDSYIIISEYNGHTQGFLVNDMGRIVNKNWEEITPPPEGCANERFITAITQVDGKTVEIIDVEKILTEITPQKEHISQDLVSEEIKRLADKETVMLVDDSSVARKQAQHCLEEVGVHVQSFKNGREAWDHLLNLVEQGIDPAEHYLMLVSDIEMPEMDGYTLTTHIRENPKMEDLRIILHSSLSGGFNEAMIKKVGANDFIPKVDPDVLAIEVVEQVKQHSRQLLK